MTHWTGPAVVVMYVDPSEVETIKSRVNSSAVMKHRENLSFHLVYKRGVGHLVALRPLWPPLNSSFLLTETLPCQLPKECWHQPVTYSLHAFH